MKRWLGLALLTFVGAAGWRIGEALSPDALSMAVGVLFGVMAGVPTALLVMAGSRRRSDEHGEPDRPRQQQGLPGYGSVPGQMNHWPMPFAQQPPVIVVAGPQGMASQPSQQYAGWLPQEVPARHFTVVGEREALVEEW